MPRFQLDYTQPVHARYRAFVEADSAEEATKLLLADSDELEHDDTVSEVLWDSMEDLKPEYVDEVKEIAPPELHKAFQDGQNLVGTYNTEIHSVSDQAQMLLLLLQGLEPNGDHSQAIGDVEFFVSGEDGAQDSHDVLWGLQDQISEALPEHIKEYFAYGIEEGTLGICVREEFEHLMEQVV